MHAFRAASAAHIACGLDVRIRLADSGPLVALGDEWSVPTAIPKPLPMGKARTLGNGAQKVLAVFMSNTRRLKAACYGQPLAPFLTTCLVFMLFAAL
jgi:hypothetical protein